MNNYENLQTPIKKHQMIQHTKGYLHKVVALSPDGFILCNSKVGQHRIVPNVRGVAIPVDIHRPFTTAEAIFPQKQHQKPQ